MRYVSIYILIDPRDQEIRYVGVTLKTLDYRLKLHLIRQKRRSPKYLWIEELKRQGLMPTIQLVQQVPERCGTQAEVFWIDHFRARGCPLLNATAGGEGTNQYRHDRIARMKMKEAWVRRRLRPNPLKGRKRPEAVRKKLRQAALRQFSDPANRIKVSLAHRGKTISMENRRKVSAANITRWAKWRLEGRSTPEKTRAKLRRFHLGKKLSPNTRAKISLAQIGRKKSPQHRLKLAEHCRHMTQARLRQTTPL
jgi:hypothetical protein